MIFKKVYGTDGSLQNAAVDPTIDYAYCLGRTTAGIGAGWRRRYLTAPAHGEWVQNINDGHYWGLWERRPELLQFGCAGNAVIANDGSVSGTNDSDALIRVQKYNRDGLCDELFFNTGQYLVSSPLLNINFRIKGRGTGRNSTIFIVNYNEPDSERGLFHLVSDAGGTPAGSVLTDFNIYGALGTFGGAAISVKCGVPNEVLPNGNITLGNLWMSAGISSAAPNRWPKMPLICDGAAATGIIPGLRDLTFNDLAVFSGAQGSILLRGCRIVSIKGGTTNIGGGTNANVVITGTNDVGSDSVKCFMDFAGDVVLSHNTRVKIYGDVRNVVSDSTCVGARIYGIPSGSVDGYWTNGRVVN